jgi:hypothetical protein
LNWYFDGMAAFARHGIQPSEFGRFKPGEARELLQRLEKMEDEEVRQKFKVQGDQVQALLNALQQVVKAIDNQSKLIAKAFGGR